MSASIVTEQAEVPWTAAPGDSDIDRVMLAEAALGGQPVQVGGIGCFQLCLILAHIGQSAQPIHDERAFLALAADEHRPGR